MRTIKISDTAYRILKEQAGKEGRFLWKLVDDALFDYLKQAINEANRAARRTEKGAKQP